MEPFGCPSLPLFLEAFHGVLKFLALQHGLYPYDLEMKLQIQSIVFKLCFTFVAQSLDHLVP